MTPSYTLGLFFAFLVVSLWTLASFFTQYLQTVLHFRGVFLFTYLSSSLFSLNFIVWYLSNKYNSYGSSGREPSKASSSSLVNSYKTLDEVDNPINNGNSDESQMDDGGDYSGVISSHHQLNSSMSEVVNPAKYTDLAVHIPAGADEDPDFESPISPSKGRGEQKSRCSVVISWLVKPIPIDYTHTDLLYGAMILMPLWFIGNFFYNYSLLFTSIGSSMVITELNGAFTLIFSYLFNVETATYTKVFGVILSFVGVVLVSWGDSETSEGGIQGRSVFGDLMALIGAVGYGLYTTLLKLKIPESRNSVIPASLLFGYFGLVASLVFLPVLFYMIAANTGGVRDLTPFVFGYIFVEEIFDAVLANYLYAKATILTTPTVTAVSVTMTVPCAIIVDFFYGGITPSIGQIMGGVLVTAGVVFVSVDINFFALFQKYCAK